MNALTERIKPAIKLLAVGVIAIGTAGCNKANSEMTHSVVKPVKLIEVPDLSTKKFDSFIATIDATDRAALSFQVAGEIESINVRMGSVVKKGDVLAELDPTDYQLAFDARLAEYNLAKTAFERAVQLHIKQLISVDTYDQNETQYKAAKAALEQARTDLNYTQIIAPFDGVVSLTFGKEYQVVGANQPVLNLIDNNVLDVVLTVPVSYVERHGLDHIADSSFQVVMDSHKQISMPAKFKEISTQPDADTNSYTASLIVKRPQQLNLLPGMTGQVQLLNEQRGEGLNFASTAWVSLQNGEGQLYRFDTKTETISLIHVVLDSNGNIVDGVTSGDLIVQAGVENLSPGQQVKAWKREGGI
ncbi:efflux RND transporter periplasmic adaptor subunit [Vibrio bivalvicida]|uniref:Efflux transporter periplasmic adaptor subunit n=1 Tax=Vibrio bivalvicida TaxID=1276888 RepID=A0A177Y049_9VIBR|nr:efflux RND transporter periplasmic adaptor subunit [Vibrio bivalvicida]OAJ94233.1 efflux transporter periplasmic adaptor subunit [Vibrio bivalvicida]